jgi:hypothetical protein
MGTRHSARGKPAGQGVSVNLAADMVGSDAVQTPEGEHRMRLG